MHRDIKEIVGAIMRVLGGGEVSPDEVMALSFEADGELEAALNEAYIKLLEFAHDAELRQSNEGADRTARSRLSGCLDRIVEACDRHSDATYGRAVRNVQAGYQFYAYDRGVEFTLIWPTQTECEAAKLTLTDVGASVMEGAIDRAAFVMLETERHRETLSALHREAHDRTRRPR